MTDRPWPTLPYDTWRGRSIEERAEGIALVCQAAMELIDSSDDAESRLKTPDPLPASTKALLRRLANDG